MNQTQALGNYTSKLILGIDEVGRGPWAGPLVVGACVLNPRYDENGQEIEAEKWQQELKDSKKLTAKKREKLEQEIKSKAKAYALGWVSAEELDEFGLSDSLRLATWRAVQEIPENAYREIVIDGNLNFLAGTKFAARATNLVKADDLIKEVSAASILAKVARDNYMIELADKYPEYGFESHVGYGTAKHRENLERFGPCPEHRFSIKPLAKWDAPSGRRTKTSSKRTATTRAIGLKAEQIVADYLVSLGHHILARNYKTRYYEIDIVSATKDHLYFTEVKYRKNHQHGSPLEAITKAKRQQMSFAAELFMHDLQKRIGTSRVIPSPILAAAAVSGDPAQLETWFEID